jgi:hypothetical protein
VLVAVLIVLTGPNAQAGKPRRHLARREGLVPQPFLLDAASRVRVAYNPHIPFPEPKHWEKRSASLGIFRRAKTACLAQKRAMNITKNLGMLLLAIYLILAGIGLLVHTLVIPSVVMGILALAAGILILIGK